MENKTGYQPIETAPKDSINILLTGKNNCGRFRTRIGFYTLGGKIEFDDEYQNYPECYDEEREISYLSEGWWLDAVDNNGNYESYFIKPDFNLTYWMPLPEPPKGTTFTITQT